jgi:hypothetical protein
MGVPMVGGVDPAWTPIIAVFVLMAYTEGKLKIEAHVLIDLCIACC